MNEAMPSYSGKTLTIDFSVYDDDIFRKLSGRLLEGFEMIDSYSDQINTFIEDITEDEKIDIGYIVSNFMYLLRAFCQNELFMNYVKTVIDEVKYQLDLSI